jgi:formylmethanofuran dehydrogenase subunit E
MSGKIYTCLECGLAFDEPQEYCEFHELDSPPYENYKGCPNCGGVFINSVICTVCNQYITDDYIHVVDGQDICENCYTNCHIYE